MAKKNYHIDNTTMTISADWTKLGVADRATVKDFIALGYSFVQKNSRNGDKRKRSFFAKELIKEDMEIFTALEKAEDGSYGRAVSFGTQIIKLGKAFDKELITEDDIDEYRLLAQDDMKKAQMFAEGLLKVA